MLIRTPSPWLRKVGDDRASSVDLAHQVRLDHGAEDVARRLLEAAVGDHPGRVDPDVDPSEPLSRPGGQGDHGELVANIGRYADRLGAQLRALAGGDREISLAPRGEDQTRAAAREGDRGGSSDSTRSARDHHDGSG
jgi:hypothetical protein